MKVLHISLGIPEGHRGGLNRYCKELIQEQLKDGIYVSLLYPGKFSPKALGSPQIVPEEGYAYPIYRMDHALPVSMGYAVREPERYMVPCKTEYFSDFLEEHKPDLIHVHSIMGVYKEFFTAARKKDIPILFTTHDYYPICRKCILTKPDGSPCSNAGYGDCAACNNSGGLSSLQHRLLQNPFYLKIKNTALIRLLRKKKQGQLTVQRQRRPRAGQEAAYAALQEYYDQIVDCFTLLHCNSKTSYRIYSGSFPDKNYEILPITHEGISLKKHVRDENRPLYLGYMGGPGVHKGFRDVLRSLEWLDAAGFHEWRLYFFGDDYTLPVSDSRIVECGRFSEKDEMAAWDKIDLLLVPSRCPETFGFVVLEALCKDIPVICSDLVGSGDLLHGLASELVFPAGNIKILADMIFKLADFPYYKTMQQHIKKLKLPADMEQHAKEVEKFYQNTICAEQ